MELFPITKFSVCQAGGTEKPRVVFFPLPSPACKLWAGAEVPSLCSALPAPSTVLMGCGVLTLLVFNRFVTLEIVSLVITYTLIPKHNFQGAKLKLQSAQETHLFAWRHPVSASDQMSNPENCYRHISVVFTYNEHTHTHIYINKQNTNNFFHKLYKNFAETSK